MLGTAAFSGLGLLLGGTLRGLTCLAVANLAWLLLLVLGGIMFDLDTFGPAEPVLRLLPSAALSDGLRATLVDGHLVGSDLLTLAVWGVARPGRRRPRLPLGVTRMTLLRTLLVLLLGVLGLTRSRRRKAGPAPAAGDDVVADDGTRLHVEVDEVPGSAVTVVFVHGFTARLEEFAAAARDPARPLPGRAVRPARARASELGRRPARDDRPARPRPRQRCSTGTPPPGRSCCSGTRWAA